MVAGKLEKVSPFKEHTKILFDWVEEWYNWVMSYFLSVSDSTSGKRQHLR